MLPVLHYTFYSVRWATQKGDILEVRAQKVTQLRGGTDLCFRCVRGPARVAQLKILGGGTALYFFQIVECTENLFLLWIAIVDNAGLLSLSLQIHTVIICPKYHHNANICIKFNPFTWNTIQWNLGKSTREEGFYFGLKTRLPQIWVLKLFEGSAWGFHF